MRSTEFECFGAESRRRVATLGWKIPITTATTASELEMEGSVQLNSTVSVFVTELPPVLYIQ